MSSQCTIEGSGRGPDRSKVENNVEVRPVLCKAPVGLPQSCNHLHQHRIAMVQGMSFLD